MKRFGEEGIKRTVLIKPMNASAHGIYVLRDFKRVKEFLDKILVSF